VNLASKMAQDLGMPGHIYLSGNAARDTRTSGFIPVQRTVSGVQVTFFEG